VLISEKAVVVVVVVVFVSGSGGENYLKQPRECDWGARVCVREQKDPRRGKGGKKKGVKYRTIAEVDFPIPFPANERACVFSPVQCVR